MRWLSAVLTVMISLPVCPWAYAQDPTPKLNLVIVEGDGAINNIRQRTAREPIVQVEDENHKPVAGAAVIFAVSEQGAGGTFANGAHSLTVITDSQGRAVARGFHPNQTQGQYQIHVTASHNGQTANANITQSNGAAGASSAASTGISGKLIAIIAIAGAAAAGGAYYATHNGSSNTTAAASAITITPGTGVVGPPR